MRVLIIGNGLSGILFAKTLRELDQKVKIDVFAKERYNYYPRPNLIEFIAGNIPFEKLFAFSDKWYQSKHIRIHLQNPAVKIYPELQEIEVENGKKEKYDTLLLASGSFSFVPPFKGADKKGLFTLKSLDDSQAILEYLDAHPKVVLVGGGLLGLEIARALKQRDADVDVVEFFPYLLPRQLDSEGAEVLQYQINRVNP